MDYNNKCHGCGEYLIIMIKYIPMSISLEVWNENNPIINMIRDKKGKLMPNCNMCGRVKKIFFFKGTSCGMSTV